MGDIVNRLTRGTSSISNFGINLRFGDNLRISPILKGLYKVVYTDAKFLKIRGGYRKTFLNQNEYL